MTSPEERSRPNKTRTTSGAGTPVVRLQELTKRYGNLTALDRFTLDIAEGEIVGLLGPNGAGKTTTLRTLLGLLKPSGGRAEIFGIDAWAHPVAAHRHLALIPGEFAVWPQLSGGQILDLLGTVSGGYDTAYRDELVERFHFVAGTAPPHPRGRARAAGTASRCYGHV